MGRAVCHRQSGRSGWLLPAVSGSVARFSLGDDDSGSDRNASFTARLFQGRTYYLRIRLYFQHRRGEFGVMMW